MSTEPKNRSTLPPEGRHLPEVCWQDIKEPGAYVALRTGDLYRVTKEALTPGSMQPKERESDGSFRLVQVSKNPFVGSLVARIICWDHHINPNF